MNSRIWSACAAAALALALSPPASAQSAPAAAWQQCDGYGKATAGGDGITAYATMFLGLMSPPGYGNSGLGTAGRGAQAAASCDTSIAQTPAQHWRRRVNLRQGRALHDLEAGHPDQALADLDLAEKLAAEAGADDHFRRSQGVGLTLVRAYAQKQAKNEGEARTLAVAALDQRPYDRGVLMLAQAMNGHADSPVQNRITAQMLRLAPEMRGGALQDYFEAGRFAEVIALYPYITPPLAKARLNELPVSVSLRCLANDERTARFKSQTGSMYAYALAAVGRSDEADAAYAQALAEARRAAGATVKPCTTIRGKALEQFNGEAAKSKTRLAALAAATAEFQAGLNRRKLLTAGRGAEALAGVSIAALPQDGSTADTLMTAAPFLPEAQAAEARAAAESIRIRLVEISRALDTIGEAFSLTELMSLIPAPESPATTPQWGEAKRAFLAMKDSQANTSVVGYRQTTAPDGTVTVRFRGSGGMGGAASPRSQVQEMALLRAADLAREAGKAGFVIIERRDTSWTNQITQYGAVLRSDPGGFETELDVRFVDPPAAAAGTWPGLMANEVYEALAPFYTRPVAPPSRRQGGGPG